MEVNIDSKKLVLNKIAPKVAPKKSKILNLSNLTNSTNETNSTNSTNSTN